VGGSPSHLAACLLESSVRERIWEGIGAGRDADSLVRLASASAEPALESATAIPVDEETEGTSQLPAEFELEREEADAPVTSQREPGRGPVGRAGVPPLEDDR
jgi:hypothetical protein